ncbi:uncharacterized protein GJ701_004625 isoform 1-T6 [Geothlypis trichas]
MLLGDAAEPGSGGVGDIGGARGRAAAQHPGELRRLLARRPPQRLGALPLGPAALAPRLRIAAQRELIPAAAAAGAPLPARLPPAPGSSRLSAAGRIPGTGRGAAGGGAGGRPGRGRLRPPPESAAGAGARGGTGRGGRSAGAGGAQNGSCPSAVPAAGTGATESMPARGSDRQRELTEPRVSEKTGQRGALLLCL